MFHLNFIDSHVHLDQMVESDPGCLDLLKKAGCLPISWAFAKQILTLENLKNYLQIQADSIQEFNKQGLPCFFLTGVHPRNIPGDIGDNDFQDILEPFLKNSFCLGIGEIGLETGSSLEKDVFTQQLVLAEKFKDTGIRVGIHTPRKNKIDITNQILDVLEAFPGLKDIIVIDHCTFQTIDQVLESGFWAGITLSPVKTSLEQLAQIVGKHRDKIDKIICNSDSGVDFYDDFYRFIREFSKKVFTSQDIQKLTCQNATQFFKLDSIPEFPFK